MRGEVKIEKREKRVDPIFLNVLVSDIVSRLMRSGKLMVALNILYDALRIIAKKMGISLSDAVGILEKAVKNCTPSLEIKSRRIGGSFIQVPSDIDGIRAYKKALFFLIYAARTRPEKKMGERLANEILLAYNNEGSAVKKKNEIQKVAEKNRVYALFSF